MMMSEQNDDLRSGQNGEHDNGSCPNCMRMCWDGECNNKAYHEDEMWGDDEHMKEHLESEMFSESTDEHFNKYHAVHKDTAMYLVFYAKDDTNASSMLPSIVNNPTEWMVTKINEELEL